VTPEGLRPGQDAQRERVREAARALETLVLKQLVAASGAFKGGDAAGSAIREDMFSTALADALVKGGGIGLAAQVERSVLGDPPAAPVPTAGPQRLPAAAPLPGAPVSSPFGPRADPVTGRPARHQGVDLAAPEGTEVRAALPGVVRLSGDRGGYGLAVELDHGGGLTTLYGHASEVLVTEGEVVTQGQPIARVGSTGRATGPHLHLEVRQGQRPVDPARALKIYGARVEGLIGSGS
jgi:murein DD-endopeptidase MepM/ murein hydrolase activator NlpD